MASIPLYSVAEASDFKINKIWKLYGDYVSSAQVNLLGTFGAGREVADHAEGCYIYTRSGRQILDLTGGIGVLGHGHNHPRILKVRKDFQENKRMEVHKNFLSPYVAALAANVGRLLPGDLDISYFPNSGGEAVDGAVKLAYKFHEGKRNWILHADISFHGKLIGAGSLTGSPEVHFKFPQMQGVDSFEYGNPSSVVEAHDRHLREDGSSDVYAIIVEPLNASSMRELSKSHLRWLRDFCDKHSIVLIFDEVYTGWGRTGHLFNFMKSDVIPDIVTYAKTLGGGKSSIAGYTTRSPIARKAYDNLTDATLHSTTYFGFGEEAATAIEAINIVVDSGFVSNARMIDRQFGRYLKDLARKSSLVSDIRGNGALWGIFLQASFWEKAISMVSKVPFTGFSEDPRFAKKIVNGAIINHLFNQHNVMTYFGTNRETPLIVSFPLVAGEDELIWAREALTETLSHRFEPLLKNFVEMRFSAPRGSQ